MTGTFSQSCSRVEKDYTAEREAMHYLAFLTSFHKSAVCNNWSFLFLFQDIDHYKYYKHTFKPFNESWIDLEKWNTSVHPGIVNIHDMLSKSYRRAATISLKFDFPFYGHSVRNITIGKFYFYKSTLMYFLVMTSFETKQAKSY